MKKLLAALSGFVLTLGVFAGGFGTAFFLLSAEPTPVWKPGKDSAGAWTLEPVTVRGGGEEYERLPPRSPSSDSFIAKVEPALDETDPDADRPDGAGTASIPERGSADPVPEAAPAMSVAHVQWCADRYRSYRVEDNRYTPYGGGSRECRSPFLEDSFARHEGGTDIAGEEVSAEMIGDFSPRHVQSCFDRYRSYRPADNSYQPYGGGPRRQCR